MADWGSEFNFFQGIHVRIDNPISVRGIITKFGKQVHLQDLTQITQMGAGNVITSRSRDKRQDHVTN